MNALLTLFFKSSPRTQCFLLALLGVVFYIPFIGSVHLFDWDEINFAEISREMIITGDYFKSQIDFQPFYEKPPLFNWIQIGSFALFGQNEFSARFPNALFGICSLLLIFKIGSACRGRTFGMLWALFYLGSLLPHFYFKTGIIDPVFNFFIFSSAYVWTLAVKRLESRLSLKYFFAAGLLNGLAVITKGPVGLLIILLMMAAYEVLSLGKKISFSKIKGLGVFLAGVFAVSLVWLLPQYILGGNAFIVEFVKYMWELLTQDVATHGQPFYYHFLVVFFGCFPISVWALPNLIKSHKKPEDDFNRWMFCLFWVVLILFSSVKTKIVHYSSMTYFPLAYLATDAIMAAFDKKRGTALNKVYLCLGLLFGLVFALLPMLLIDKSFLLNLSKNDAFAVEIIKALEMSPWYGLAAVIFIAAVMGAYWLFSQGKIREAVLTHSLGIALFLNVELALVLPPVELAVQGAAIDFYKRFAGEDVYVATVGFKSYGRLYYSDKKAGGKHYTEEELITLDVDKPVFFIAKINTADQLKDSPNIRLIDSKGGYLLFFKPVNKNVDGNR